MRKAILICFFLICGLQGVFALELPINSVKKTDSVKVTAKLKTQTLKLDSSKIEQRNLDEQAINRLSKEKDFIYDDVAPTTLSWWDRFWRWFWDIIRQGLSGPSTGPILKYLFIGLGIAALLFIAFKLVGLDPKLFSMKSKNVEVPYVESLENIHEINFDEQLAAALAQKDYRLAVRLLYLKSLKKLSDLQLIDWKVEKTNRTYVEELADENQKSRFKSLTNQFEYIWYGEFFIDEPGFDSISHAFHQFNEEMK